MAQAPGTPTNEGHISQQYVVSVATIPPAPKPKIYSPDPWRCLASVQYWIPEVPKGIGRASNLKPNLDHPKIGAVIITTEGPFGHVGEVTDVEVWPSYVSVVFRECNFRPGQCDYRTLRSDASQITGYYDPVAATLAVIE